MLGFVQLSIIVRAGLFHPVQNHPVQRLVSFNQLLSDCDELLMAASWIALFILNHTRRCSCLRNPTISFLFFAFDFSFLFFRSTPPLVFEVPCQLAPPMDLDHAVIFMQRILTLALFQKTFYILLKYL